jgi:hypothetical protein
MIVEAGVEKGIAEHWVAGQLFRSSYNRLIFEGLDTNEQRMAWLHFAKQGMSNKQG